MKMGRLVPAAVVLAGGLTLAAAGFATSSADAPATSCPGRIVCPLTGDEICKDRCPLEATASAPAAPAVRDGCEALDP